MQTKHSSSSEQRTLPIIMSFRDWRTEAAYLGDIVRNLSVEWQLANTACLCIALCLIVVRETQHTHFAPHGKLTVDRRSPQMGDGIEFTAHRSSLFLALAPLVCWCVPYILFVASLRRIDNKPWKYLLVRAFSSRRITDSRIAGHGCVGLWLDSLQPRLPGRAACNCQ
jgi:hypothetical protein